MNVRDQDLRTLFAIAIGVLGCCVAVTGLMVAALAARQRVIESKIDQVLYLQTFIESKDDGRDSK